MKKILSLLLILVSVPAFAAKEVVSELGIQGQLQVNNPGVIALSDGAYELQTVETCRFLGISCNNKRLRIKNSKESADISLSKKDEIISSYKLKSFQFFSDFSEESKSADSSLKMSFKTKLGERKVSFEFKEHPELCENICTDSYSYCDGTLDEWRNCSGRTVEGCHDYTQRCTPAYEECLKVTEAPIRLEMLITEVKTQEVAARFFSEERKYKSSEKVKMASCFQN